MFRFGIRGDRRSAELIALRQRISELETEIERIATTGQSAVGAPPAGDSYSRSRSLRWALSQEDLTRKRFELDDIILQRRARQRATVV